MTQKLLQLVFVVTLFISPFFVRSESANAFPREKLLMDLGWKFAFGHPYDASKDFNHGTSYFSYLAKAGYGDGAADANFDDRAWRVLDLPHDFAVEQPFSNAGSHSHGYKAIGRNFPDVSVGWYRKSFEIPESDKGRRITITFDGVHRDARVFFNGHYLGNEPSGYNSFGFDVTEYVNFGGKNVIAVRVDVTYEEGWYYEGAGIYRHVWLTKTKPLHVDTYGTFVYSDVKGNIANLTIQTTLKNQQTDNAGFQLKQELFNAERQLIADNISPNTSLPSGEKIVLKQTMSIQNPRLWSMDDPYLHTMVTTVISNGEVVDMYETKTGIRTIHFDANEGFFLNGKHVKLKGTNNHQDHAGVGTAMPDELIRFRVSKLKEMGSNAIRSSHNPATPELLEICDQMGMLVINENRLMGTAPFVYDQLERLIKRDRNHPCIAVWSLGNEEWALEGNPKGEPIIQAMQAFAKKIDPTRPMNAASSGGWGHGISKHIEVMGFNYHCHGNTDEYHKNFPNTPAMGTEEGSTHATRGVYFDNAEKQHIAAYDQMTANKVFVSIEDCWKHYNSRPYLAGMFIWTGFDYRGESTPYGWPSINSYFGMYDMCGFAKDNVWYLKSWWGNEPVLHLMPHWNWAGKEGDTIKVVAYSNLDEVELFVNNRSAGRKKMEKDSHLAWNVPYKAGSIKAIAYKNGKKQLEKMVETTSEAYALKLQSHKSNVKANGEDLAIVTVSTTDKKGRQVPTTNNLVTFEIEGPGKIIGVGNGNQTCHEPDKYIEKTEAISIKNMKAKLFDSFENRTEVTTQYDDSGWQSQREITGKMSEAKAIVYRGTLELPENLEQAEITFYYNCIGNNQNLYLNGKLIGENLSQKRERYTLKIAKDDVKPGKNIIAIVATPFVVRNSWDNPNTNPGVVQVKLPAENYKRSLFSGLAQVIVQSTGEPGIIRVTAKAEGLSPAVLTIQANEAEKRHMVE